MGYMGILYRMIPLSINMLHMAHPRHSFACRGWAHFCPVPVAGDASFMLGPQLMVGLGIWE